MSSQEQAEQARLIEQMRQIRVFLGGARLDRQVDEHLRFMQCREREACNRLLNHSYYRAWSLNNGPHAQNLALVGDMGCGKSTSMSLIIQSITPPNQSDDERPSLGYYYCLDENACPFSIIASLTYGLIANSTSMQDSLFRWYKRARERCENTDQLCNMLVNWLKKEIRNQGLTPYLIIDAIDQCTPQNRHTVLAYLNEICEYAILTKVLVSTRAEKQVVDQLDYFDKIWFDDKENVDELIARRHVSLRMSYLSPELRGWCIEYLTKRAECNARWISEVIDELRVAGYRKQYNVQAFIKGAVLPTNLHSFYRSTYAVYLQKGNGSVDEPILQTALEYLAVSPRPLTMIELVHMCWIDVMEDTCHLQRIPRPTNFAQCASLMTQISPFVSAVYWEDRDLRQMKLSHEAVRQFVLREWARGGPIQPVKGSYGVTPEQQQAIGERIESLTAAFQRVAKRLQIRDLY